MSTQQEKINKNFEPNTEKHNAESRSTNLTPCIDKVRVGSKRIFRVWKIKTRTEQKAHCW